MTAALRVIAPGLMTTLQDLGRLGYQHLGVPVSGALDPVCLRAANLLAGNPAGTARWRSPTRVRRSRSRPTASASRGRRTAQRSISSLPRRRRRQAPCPLRERPTDARAALQIGALWGSAVAYLAVEGGFDVAPVLGSQSTLTRGGIGGFEGRALHAGDLLPLRPAAAAEREEVMLPPLDLRPRARFRVVLGPQDDHFTHAGLATLLGSPYTISRASDRMGMRLEGPTLEHSAKGYNIVSDGIAPGSIQVPGNGLPIVLLADRQTTGGYPKVATVISADLPALGRMTPGARIAFEAVGIEAAEAAARSLPPRSPTCRAHGAGTARLDRRGQAAGGEPRERRGQRARGNCRKGDGIQSA